MYDLIYVADTYCGWCYGFSATARELARDPEINMQVKHGALFSGERSVSLDNLGYIAQANDRIAALTGASFGEPYQQLLKEGSTVMDSDDGARGLMALRSVAGEDRGVEAVGALQEAFYQGGLSLSEDAAYRYAAERLNIDAARVLQVLATEENREKAKTEQREVLSIGVSHYPTLAVVTPTGLVEVGSPTASAEQIKAEIKQVTQSR